MAQQHGLGRGLSSLIPPQKDGKAEDNPRKDQALRSMQAQGVDFSARPTATPSKSDADPVPQPTAKPSVQTEKEQEKGQGAPKMLPVSDIVPNPHQPRLRFDEEKLGELSESIREHGVLQPLIVTPLSEGKYELIAGERRLQASKKAGLVKVPVIIREAGEQQKLELAVIENIQRHDLNPLEEAKAYARLTDEFGMTQEEVARKMGKSRSAVANVLRLLILPVEIQRAVAEGKISEGHAKALLAVENPEKQRALFELVMKSGLTVRDTERQARETSVRPHVRRSSSLSPELASVAEKLSSALGTKVALKPTGKGGKIVVEYYSDEELGQIVSRFDS